MSWQDSIPGAHAVDTSRTYQRPPLEQAAANEDLGKQIIFQDSTPGAHAVDTLASPTYRHSPLEQAAANQGLGRDKAPSQAGMIASNHDLNIFNGTFYHVHGDVQRNSAPKDIIASMQANALETMPGSVKGTLRIPRFSRSLLLRDWSVDTSGPPTARLEGSCAYDLASTLRLLPGQENEKFAEYDGDIAVDRAISRGQCYCGRISRHGLIFLISRHLQDITTAETTSTGSPTIIAQTTLGRFKFYEQNDKSFVHFDRGTRSSIVDLIPNQKLENILKAASGQYFLKDITITSDDIEFIWHRCSGYLLENLATGDYFGISDSVMYLNRDALETWKRLLEFSGVMLEAMTSVLDDLEEPRSFVEALGKLPNRRPSPSGSGTGHGVDCSDAPAARLAFCVYLSETLSTKKIECLDDTIFHDFIRANYHDLIRAHQHFRSPKVQDGKLFSTSKDRFMAIFRKYSMADSSTRSSGDAVRGELLALLRNNPNNVALVAYQGFFAIATRVNSGRVLLRAREAPQEWIRFMAADDDYIYIG